MTVWSGIAARSIALVGFGLDSVIEIAAALALAWRQRVEARGVDSEEIGRSGRLVHSFVGATCSRSKES